MGSFQSGMVHAVTPAHSGSSYTRLRQDLSILSPTARWALFCPSALKCVRLGNLRAQCRLNSAGNQSEIKLNQRNFTG
jgi:hypothetical protein